MLLPAILQTLVVTSSIRNIVSGVLMLDQQDFENLTDYTNYLCKMCTELESLSQGHIRWYTHKNPYGCWICDLTLLLRRWEDLYYPKSVKIVMNKVLEDEENEDVIKSS